MSFSKSVKDELVQTEYEAFCCKKSLLYGMCLFGKSFDESSVSLQTESENAAGLYSDLLIRLYNIKNEIKKSPGGRNYTVSVSEKQDCMKLQKVFDHIEKGSKKINHSVFDCENCRNAFVAGAFLSCGTISSPEKDYHLEFSIPYFNLSKSLQTLLDEMELKPKYVNRNGYNVIYFKESESIEDCLYMMGASDAMFEMMNIKIMKDFRNKANRQANCETANINRMVNAVAEQMTAIDKIWKLRGREYLNENLQSVAELRYDNPDLSLLELSQLCDPPLSKSGLNHRLKRIVEISKEL